MRDYSQFRSIEREPSCLASPAENKETAKIPTRFLSLRAEVTYGTEMATPESGNCSVMCLASVVSESFLCPSMTWKGQKNSCVASAWHKINCDAARSEVILPRGVRTKDAPADAYMDQSCGNKVLAHLYPSHDHKYI